MTITLGKHPDLRFQQQFRVYWKIVIFSQWRQLYPVLTKDPGTRQSYSWQESYQGKHLHLYSKIQLPFSLNAWFGNQTHFLQGARNVEHASPDWVCRVLGKHTSQTKLAEHAGRWQLRRQGSNIFFIRQQANGDYCCSRGKLENAGQLWRLRPLGLLPRGGDLHAPGHNNFIGSAESDRLTYAGGVTVCMLEGTT